MGRAEWVVVEVGAGGSETETEIRVDIDLLDLVPPVDVHVGVEVEVDDGLAMLAEVDAALEGLERIDELEDVGGVEDAGDEDVDDEESRPLTRSGFMPCAVESGPLSRLDFVARSLRLHEALADLAAQELVPRDAEEALRSLADVCAHLDDIEDRRPYARVLIGFGECLVDLGFAEYAERPVTEAIGIADALEDARLGAIARRTLGRARLVLSDASCRPLLEEALAMFTEAEDHVLADDVAALLRAARAEFIELPRARPKLRAAR